jgi:hypothetical protein
MGINNNNNKRINDDYGRHQDLILLFKIPTGTHPQKGSPTLPQGVTPSKYVTAYRLFEDRSGAILRTKQSLTHAVHR